MVCYKLVTATCVTVKSYSLAYEALGMAVFLPLMYVYSVPGMEDTDGLLYLPCEWIREKVRCLHPKRCYFSIMFLFTMCP